MQRPPIDLRSDTVTRPSSRMRAVMARADVGDDVYGEDPTVRQLEERVADVLGQEAAVFVPTGTMGNQIAIALFTRPGDEVLVAQDSHCEHFESGAAGALAGVQFRSVGPRLTADDLRLSARPTSPYQPESRLAVLENTHNASGGRVTSLPPTRSLVEEARRIGLGIHLDGARLWNASVALGIGPDELARGFDTVSVCFSKGLGAPVGSALCGRRDTIVRARRLRKQRGGGMRQAGIVAAGALFALAHHRDDLAKDHTRARRIAEALADVPGVHLVPEEVETNIIRLTLSFDGATRVGQLARESGVLVHVTGSRSLRLVTHRDLSDADVDEAIAVVSRTIDDVARQHPCSTAS